MTGSKKIHSGEDYERNSFNGSDDETIELKSIISGGSLFGVARAETSNAEYRDVTRSALSSSATGDERIENRNLDDAKGAQISNSLHPDSGSCLQSDGSVSSLFPSMTGKKHRIVNDESMGNTENHFDSEPEYGPPDYETNGEASYDDYASKVSNNIQRTQNKRLTGNDVSPEISDSNDDIRSSVLHRILDNESFEEEITHDKIFFNRLYDRYNTHTNSNKGRSELSDFEQYNNLLRREEVLKNRLSSIAKRKGKNIGKNRHYQDNNVLMTLDETDLNSLFGHLDNPKDWNEKDNNLNNRTLLGLKKKSLIQNLMKNFSSKEDDKRNSIPEKNKESYMDYVSTFSSIPIDDDIASEDLPIDVQQLRRHHITTSTNKDIDATHDIDIVVSSQEKVDYNLHKIDNYQDIDPNDINLLFPNSNYSNPKPKSLFGKILNSINLVRIIRIQSANKYQIQRKLNVRHLHQIALGGTLGIGLLLSSGKAFTIAGPLGCLLGFSITGFVVIATMLSFCEIVTLIPLCGGVSGIASRFVDDAFGFALGVVYWVTYMISMPTEITAATLMLSFYPEADVPGPKTAGWISLLLGLTLLLNLFDIRVYGEFEYYSTIVKLLMLIGLMIYMVVLNTGASGPLYQRIGFKYWDSNLSDLSEHITFGLFRPTFDINDTGTGSLGGIGGHRGRILQVLIAAVVASSAYVGTEIVILAGSESTNPRQSIPSATKNIYLRIILFYLVGVFLVGLNIYSGDPRLLRYFTGHKATAEDIKIQDAVVKIIGGDECKSGVLVWQGFSNGNQSPFVIAIQSAGVCGFASAVNAFLLYFALTAASSQLYASSRTLYFMSIQNKAPKIFSLCTKKGVPYMSVLFTGAFGLLSFLSVENDTALIFERMISVCATAGLLVWSGMCLSFIRFYFALKLRPDIVNRKDDDYPYRSPFQPYLAYLGLIIGVALGFAAGFVVFLRDEWSTSFFISSYGCLVLVIICYFGYKIFRRTKIQRLDQIDLDSGRREIDRVIWEDEKHYVSNFKEILTKGVNLFI